MSMIQKQIKDMEDIIDILEANSKKGLGSTCEEQERAVKELRDAIDTIESLSLKLHAHNMHSGWIPVFDQFPKDGEIVLACKNGRISILRYEEKLSHWHELRGNWWWSENMVTAWMPLPEPYKEDK